MAAAITMFALASSFSLPQILLAYEERDEETEESPEEVYDVWCQGETVIHPRRQHKETNTTAKANWFATREAKAKAKRSEASH